MFRCSDCGQEFKIKPDFCDCGNNVFEELVSEKPISVLEKYEISIFALSFFITCLILSVLTILFFANPKPQAQNKQIQTLKPIKNIPSIDTFWDNTPIKQVEEKVEAPILQKIIPVIKPKTQTVVQKPVVKEQVSKQLEKKQGGKQEVTQVPKPVVKKTEPVKPVVSQEVINYKLRLRNALFSKLDYAKLVGKGKCGIQFSVNTDGKLVNRAFTFHSDNKVINDEIYKMIMRMPTYEIPPAEYKGELIKFVFEFDNGSYEVTLGN